MDSYDHLFGEDGTGGMLESLSELGGSSGVGGVGVAAGGAGPGASGPGVGGVPPVDAYDPSGVAVTGSRVPPGYGQQPSAYAQKLSAFGSSDYTHLDPSMYGHGQPVVGPGGAVTYGTAADGRPMGPPGPGGGPAGVPVGVGPTYGQQQRMSGRPPTQQQQQQQQQATVGQQGAPPGPGGPGGAVGVVPGGPAHYPYPAAADSMYGMNDHQMAAMQGGWGQHAASNPGVVASGGGYPGMQQHHRYQHMNAAYRHQQHLAYQQQVMQPEQPKQQQQQQQQFPPSAQQHAMMQQQQYPMGGVVPPQHGQQQQQQQRHHAPPGAHYGGGGGVQGAMYPQQGHPQQQQPYAGYTNMQPQQQQQQQHPQRTTSGVMPQQQQQQHHHQYSHHQMAELAAQQQQQQQYSHMGGHGGGPSVGVMAAHQQVQQQAAVQQQHMTAHPGLSQSNQGHVSASPLNQQQQQHPSMSPYAQHQQQAPPSVPPTPQQQFVAKHGAQSMAGNVSPQYRAPYPQLSPQMSPRPPQMSPRPQQQQPPAQPQMSPRPGVMSPASGNKPNLSPHPQIGGGAGGAGGQTLSPRPKSQAANSPAPNLGPMPTYSQQSTLQALEQMVMPSGASEYPTFHGSRNSTMQPSNPLSPMNVRGGNTSAGGMVMDPQQQQWNAVHLQQQQQQQHLLHQQASRLGQMNNGMTMNMNIDSSSLPPTQQTLAPTPNIPNSIQQQQQNTQQQLQQQLYNDDMRQQEQPPKAAILPDLSLQQSPHSAIPPSTEQALSSPASVQSPSTNMPTSTTSVGNNTPTHSISSHPATPIPTSTTDDIGCPTSQDSNSMPLQGSEGTVMPSSRSMEEIKSVGSNSNHSQNSNTSGSTSLQQQQQQQQLQQQQSSFADLCDSVSSVSSMFSSSTAIQQTPPVVSKPPMQMDDLMPAAATPPVYNQDGTIPQEKSSDVGSSLAVSTTCTTPTEPIITNTSPAIAASTNSSPVVPQLPVPPAPVIPSSIPPTNIQNPVMVPSLPPQTNIYDPSVTPIMANPGVLPPKPPPPHGLPVPQQQLPHGLGHLPMGPMAHGPPPHLQDMMYQPPISHHQERAALQQQIQEIYCMPPTPENQEKARHLQERLNILQQHEATEQCNGGPQCVLQSPMFATSMIDSPQVSSTTGRGRGKGTPRAKKPRLKKGEKNVITMIPPVPPQILPNPMMAPPMIGQIPPMMGQMQPMLPLPPQQLPVSEDCVTPGAGLTIPAEDITDINDVAMDPFAMDIEAGEKKRKPASGVRKPREKKPKVPKEVVEGAEPKAVKERKRKEPVDGKQPKERKKYIRKKKTDVDASITDDSNNKSIENGGETEASVEVFLPMDGVTDPDDKKLSDEATPVTTTTSSSDTDQKPDTNTSDDPLADSQTNADVSDEKAETEDSKKDEYAFDEVQAKEDDGKKPAAIKRVRPPSARKSSSSKSSKSRSSLGGSKRRRRPPPHDPQSDGEGEDLVRTPPPSPPEDESSTKRRSARNTQRKKYVDDVMIRFSDDDTPAPAAPATTAKAKKAEKAAAAAAAAAEKTEKPTTAPAEKKEESVKEAVTSPDSANKPNYVYVNTTEEDSMVVHLILVSRIGKRERRPLPAAVEIEVEKEVVIEPEVPEEVKEEDKKDSEVEKSEAEEGKEEKSEVTKEAEVTVKDDEPEESDAVEESKEKSAEVDNKIEDDKIESKMDVSEVDEKEPVEKEEVEEEKTEEADKSDSDCKPEVKSNTSDTKAEDDSTPEGEDKSTTKDETTTVEEETDIKEAGFDTEEDKENKKIESEEKTKSKEGETSVKDEKLDAKPLTKIIIEKSIEMHETIGPNELIDVEEYYVKYRNFSYLHCEWKTEEELYKGDKRINIKIKRYRQKLATQINIFENPEDEPFNPDFVEVDRVLDVATHTDAATKETVKHYLVKWRSLQYEDSTWELEEDVDPIKIEQYVKFCKPPPRDKMRKKRPTPDEWKKLDESPIYKGGNNLREYQLEGLNWLLFSWYNSRNCILADEMGLGKTIQSLTFIHSAWEYGIRGPFLVIAPLSTIPNWQREIESWTDMNVIVYHGSGASRNMLQEYEMYYKTERGNIVRDCTKFNIIITTFEVIVTDFAELKGFNWRICVIDEAHRLKNRNCKLLEGLRQLTLEHRVLLSGTPLQNNVSELFSLLNFLEPLQFASAEVFLQEFGALKSETEVQKLQALLKPMMLRRLKEDVEKSLGPKEETVVEVELTNIQKKYYRGILERNFSFLSKGTTSQNIPNLMNTMMELRKCCIHPYLLNGAEDQIHIEYRQQYGEDTESYCKALIQSSGKMVLLDKLLPKLKANGHRVLIFSQMVRLLDILEDYLMYKKYPFERIDGRIRGNLRQAAIDRYSRPDSDRFVFLLCTKAGGLGINLTAADTVIIYDSDWNPQNDLQAQARCHRIGQTKMVKIYRLLCRNTYEREMFDKASLKLGLDKAVLQSMNTQGGKESGTKQLSKKEIEDLLKKGAYGALLDEEDGDKFCEEDIDVILARRTQVITMESEKGSTFSKASFAASGNRSDINIDDPDFWNKWAKKAEIDTTEKDDTEDLVISEPRRRTQIKRYGHEESAIDMSELESEPGSDSDPDLEGMSLGMRNRRRKEKLRRRMLRAAADEYQPKDVNDRQGDIVYGSWARRECFMVERGLLTFGWGRWAEILVHSQLRKGWREQDVEDCARVILLYCLRFYRGDEKIRAFIWDLIAPLENGEPTRITRNHHGLKDPVPRGIRNKHKRGAYHRGSSSSSGHMPGGGGGHDREMSSGGGGGGGGGGGSGTKDNRHPALTDPNHWSRSDKYDGDIFLESNYKKHLGRHANKVLLRVRMLYYIKHEIIGDLVQHIADGVNASALPISPPATEQLPAEWWDSDCDRSLLVGTWKHGYEAYAAMRSDVTLCFLGRCGPPTARELEMGAAQTAVCLVPAAVAPLDELEDENSNEELSSATTSTRKASKETSSIDDMAEPSPGPSASSADTRQPSLEPEDPVDEKAQWPNVSDLNTRLRRVITSYQRNYRKEEQKLAASKIKPGGMLSSMGASSTQAGASSPSTSTANTPSALESAMAAPLAALAQVSQQLEARAAAEGGNSGSAASGSGQVSLPAWDLHQLALYLLKMERQGKQLEQSMRDSGGAGKEKLQQQQSLSQQLASAAAAVAVAAAAASGAAAPTPQLQQQQPASTSSVTAVPQQQSSPAVSTATVSVTASVASQAGLCIAKKWSKREEADFFRVVSSYGILYQRKRKCYSWTQFRVLAKLDKKSDEDLTDYYKHFVVMCKKQTGTKSDDEQYDSTIEHITEEKARRTLERLELLSRIREDIITHPRLEDRLRRVCVTSADMPDWWTAGKHDLELLHGVAKHGLGRTEYYILNDREFSFHEMLRRKPPSLQSSLTIDDTKQAIKLESHEDILKFDKNEILVKLEKGEGTLKIEKVALKKESDKLLENKDSAAKDFSKDSKLEVTVVKSDDIVKEKGETDEGVMDLASKPMEGKEENREDDAKKDIEDTSEKSCVDKSIEEEAVDKEVSKNKDAKNDSEIEAPERLEEPSKETDSKLEESIDDKVGHSELYDKPMMDDDSLPAGLEPEVMLLEGTDIKPSISSIASALTMEMDSAEDLCSKQAAELKAMFPDLEVIQPLQRMAHIDTFMLKDKEKAALDFSETTVAQLFSNSGVKWPKEYAIQVRLQHIIYALETKEWPVTKSFSAYASGIGNEYDIAIHELPNEPHLTATSSSCKRDTSTPTSSVADSEVITITTDSLGRGDALGRKRKRHIAIDVETERAKLHALLNSTSLTTTSHPSATKQHWSTPSNTNTNNNPNLPDDDSDSSRRSTPVPQSAHQQPPPAHQGGGGGGGGGDKGDRDRDRDRDRGSSGGAIERERGGGSGSAGVLNLGRMFDLKYSAQSLAKGAQIGQTTVIPGTSSTLTPIDLSSGLTKPNMGDVQSEVQDFSMPSKKSIFGNSSSGQSKMGNKLDDTLSKLMKRKNCPEPEPLIGKEKKRRKLDEIVLGLSAAREQIYPDPSPPISSSSSSKKPTVTPSVTVTPTTAPLGGSHGGHGSGGGHGSSGGHMGGGGAGAQKPFTITVTSVPSGGGGGGSGSQRASGGGSSGSSAMQSMLAGMSSKDSFSTFLAQAEQQNMLLKKQQQQQQQQQRKSYEAMIADISKVTDFSSKINSYSHEAKVNKWLAEQNAALAEQPLSADYLAPRRRRPRVDPSLLDWKKLTGEENVSVINRHTGKKLTGPKAPTLKRLGAWLMENPMYDIDPKWSELVKERGNLSHDLHKRLPGNGSSSSGVVGSSGQSSSGNSMKKGQPGRPPLLSSPTGSTSSVSSANLATTMGQPSMSFPNLPGTSLSGLNSSLLSGLGLGQFDPKNPMLMPFGGGMPNMNALNSMSGLGNLSNMNLFANLASLGIPGLAGMDPSMLTGEVPTSKSTSSTSTGSKNKPQKMGDSSGGKSQAQSSSSSSSSSLLAAAAAAAAASSIPATNSFPFFFHNPSLLYTPLGLGGLNPFSLQPGAGGMSSAAAYDALAQQCGLLNGLNPSAVQTSTSQSGGSSKSGKSRAQTNMTSATTTLSSTGVSNSDRKSSTRISSRDVQLQQLLLPPDTHLLESISKAAGSIDATFKSSKSDGKKDDKRRALDSLRSMLPADFINLTAAAAAAATTEKTSSRERKGSSSSGVPLSIPGLADFSKLLEQSGQPGMSTSSSSRKFQELQMKEAIEQYNKSNELLVAMAAEQKYQQHLAHQQMQQQQQQQHLTGSSGSSKRQRESLTTAATPTPQPAEVPEENPSKRYKETPSDSRDKIMSPIIPSIPATITPAPIPLLVAPCLPQVMIQPAISTAPSISLIPTVTTAASAQVGLDAGVDIEALLPPSTVVKTSMVEEENAKVAAAAAAMAAAAAAAQAIAAAAAAAEEKLLAKVTDSDQDTSKPKEASISDDGSAPQTSDSVAMEAADEAPKKGAVKRTRAKRKSGDIPVDPEAIREKKNLRSSASRSAAAAQARAERAEREAKQLESEQKSAAAAAAAAEKAATATPDAAVPEQT